VVPGADDHEIYVSNPEILATWLATRTPSGSHIGHPGRA
jgi:hypothetical protein